MSQLDDDLFRRFHALRAPSTPPAQVTPIQTRVQAAQLEDADLNAIADGRFLPEVSVFRPGPGAPGPSGGQNDPDADLSKRLKSLRGGEAAYASVDASEDEDEQVIGDDDVEAYLSALAASNPPDEAETADEVNSAKRLETSDKRLGGEADDALQAAEPHMQDSDGEKSDTVENEEIEDEDEETEEQIIARVLAEASLERAVEGAQTEDEGDPMAEVDRVDEVEEGGKVEEDDADPSPAFPSLPSLPTHVPEMDTENALDDDTQKRIQQLLGLSFPTTKPGNTSGQPVLPSTPKREVGQGWNLPGYNDSRDDDLDSWCCICNKDADLVCLGCDEDLYCTECWRDGHDFEKHRVKKFSWNRKKAVGV